MQEKNIMPKSIVAFSLCAIPLIVGVHPQTGDLFSYWKAAAAITAGGLSLIFLNSMLGVIMAAFLLFAVILDSHPRPFLFETWGTYISYVAIFLLSVSYARRWLMPFLAASAIVISLVGILQFFGFRPIVWFIQAAYGGKIVYSYITSTLHNENYIGVYCSLVLPVMAVYSVEKKWLYIFPTAALALLLIFSRSWLGVLGVAAAFLLYLFLPARRLRPKLYLLSAVIVATLLYSAWRSPAGVVQDVKMLVAKTEIVDNKDKLFGSRGYIWRGAVESTHLYPNGPGRLAETFPYNQIAEINAGYRPPIIIDRPHSVYLQIAHSFGWWGLLLYLASTWLLAFKCAGGPFKPSERAFCIGCWLGIVGFHAAGVFSDGGPAVWPVFAVLLGAGVSGGYRPQQMI